MFEIGKGYKFTIIEGGDEVTFWRRVEKYEHPLLKCADIINDSEFFKGPPTPGEIINVISPNFVGAVMDDRE